MTNQEILLINKLREEGYGYKKISNETGISLNTIKSYLRRIENPKAENMAIRKNGEQCECCGQKLVQIKGRKIKRFCSDTCRNNWWKNHPDSVNKKAYYSCVCANCKKEFTSYGNKGRKYCCHECYLMDRYGGAR